MKKKKKQEKNETIVLHLLRLLQLTVKLYEHLPRCILGTQRKKTITSTFIHPDLGTKSTVIMHVKVDR